MRDRSNEAMRGDLLLGGDDVEGLVREEIGPEAPDTLIVECEFALDADATFVTESAEVADREDMAVG